MNESKFKDLDLIKNFRVRFKCLEDLREGCYKACFRVYDNDKIPYPYEVDYRIWKTDYVTTEEGNIKSNKELINEKYGNLEKYSQKAGYKDLVDKILTNKLKKDKRVNVNLITDIPI